MAAKSKSHGKSKKSGGGPSAPDSKKRKRHKDGGDKDASASLPSNKKRALKAERQSHRKHAEAVRSSKEIWNELRVKTNDKATNEWLCTELHELLRGKCMEVAMQHDASRCVQGVLQFGSEGQRREVAMELCDAEGGGKGGGKKKKEEGKDQNVDLAELCKSQYAHFVALKMIKYCARDEACIKVIVKSLKKQMTKLAVHSVGSRVVELLFATFPAKSTAPLKLELYGPQNALFASAMAPADDGKKAKNDNAAPTLPSLSSFVESNPDKLEPTLSHLQSLLQKGLDKSLTGFAYFHSLLLDYAAIASPNDIRSFLAPALAEHSLHLLSTRAGTRVVCECAAYGTVKDRKKIIKCLKGYTRSSLLHRDAYLAILRMCDVMDDTVLVNKMLLAELHENPNAKDGGGEEDGDGGRPSPILDLVLSDTGSKLFLLLLVPKDEGPEEGAEAKSKATTKGAPRWRRYLDPYELEVLHRDPSVTENGEAAPTSKKEDETRRRELSVYLKDLLVECCTKHAGKMMRSKPGSRVLMEACEAFPNEEALAAVVDACAKSDGAGEGEALSMLEDPVGHLTLKHMFLSEAKRSGEDDDDDEPSLARMFLSKFRMSMGDIASTNRGAFVLSALIQVPSVRNEVMEALKGHEKSIAKLAKGGKDAKKLAGCSVLLDALKA